MKTSPSNKNDLERHLSILTSFFPKWGNWLSWSKVLFLESKSITDGRVPKIPRSALISTKNYTERFEQLLDKGYSWINMNAFGIWDDNLIVVIELPSYESNLPRDKVPINFSGPSIIGGKPQWDLSTRIEIVE